MMSHTGSPSRSGRSPAGCGRSVASGAVRSAILTYFRQVAMRHAATTWIVALPDVAPGAIVAPTRHALVGPSNHTGCWARTQKRSANDRRTLIAAAPACRRGDPYGGNHGREAL